MKRRLYLKLLAGYALYGVIGFLIIATFTYHAIFTFVERREAASLYRESAQISAVYAEHYFTESLTLDETKTQLNTLSAYLSAEIWIVDTRGKMLVKIGRAHV